MKSLGFTLILALLLALPGAATACADHDAEQVEEVQTHKCCSAQPMPEEEGEMPCSNDCSSDCKCACCATIGLILEFEPLQEVSDDQALAYFSFYIPPSAAYQKMIWDPPRQIA